MPAKPPKKKIPPPANPLREPDHVSKRGVNYWWSPEWVRGTDGSNRNFGRIKAVKEKDPYTKQDTVNLYMYSKEGKLSYIQGSIQKEFKDWHEQRKIDYFFLADDPEALDAFILEAEEDV